MKVQCPSCREIVEMREFSTSDAGLRFLCSTCGAVTFLKNPANAPPEPAPAGNGAARMSAAIPGVVCPKCGFSQDDTVACHLCGLVFAKFDPAALPPDPPEAAALWNQLAARPEDQALHESFQNACLATNRLDYASRQYRLLSQNPLRKELAEKMLKRLVGLAQVQLVPGNLVPGGRTEPTRKGRTLMWIAIVAVMGGLAYLTWSLTKLLVQMSP